MQLKNTCTCVQANQLRAKEDLLGQKDAYIAKLELQLLSQQRALGAVTKPGRPAPRIAPKPAPAALANAPGGWSVRCTGAALARRWPATMVVQVGAVARIAPCTLVPTLVVVFDTCRSSQEHQRCHSAAPQSCAACG